MKLDILRTRMQNERLIGAPFAKPEDVVRWFGAVQSQDYGAAKWAVGQRLRDATDAVVEKAFQAGAILRTHVMRPTWHFVMPEDIRWMLALTAPRVAAFMGYYNRQLALDAATFKRSNSAIAKALRGGNHLTRVELARVLAGAGIVAEGQRLGHLVSQAELDAVVCSGPRRAKQFTYALLDERAPAAQTLSRDQALAELASRYFTSHGPATVHDFSWWSGLTVADAKAGIEMATPLLDRESLDRVTYWFHPTTTTARLKDPTVHLLPNYDEYFIAYKDRSAFFSASLLKRGVKDETFDRHVIALNGRIVGGWRRTLDKDSVVVETRLLTRFEKTQAQALRAAAERYARFLGVNLRTSSTKGRERERERWVAL